MCVFALPFPLLVLIFCGGAICSFKMHLAFSSSCSRLFDSDIFVPVSLSPFDKPARCQDRLRGKLNPYLGRTYNVVRNIEPICNSEQIKMMYDYTCGRISKDRGH